MIAAEQQDMAIAALVGRWLARRKKSGAGMYVDAIDFGRGGCFGARNLLRRVEILENQFARAIRTPMGEQPTLHADEGHRQSGAHRGAHRRAGIGMQSAGNVHGQHRQTAGVDPFDRFEPFALGRAIQTRAEQGVGHQIEVPPLPGLELPERAHGRIVLDRHAPGPGDRAAELFGIRQIHDLDSQPESGRQRRDDIAVATVVARARQHEEASGARPAFLQSGKGRGAGPPHEFEFVDAERFQGQAGPVREPAPPDKGLAADCCSIGHLMF